MYPYAQRVAILVRVILLLLCYLFIYFKMSSKEQCFMIIYKMTSEFESNIENDKQMFMC